MMTNKIRLVAAALAAALAIGTALPASRTNAVTELELMGWSSSPGENTRLQAIVDDWNKANPEIQVTLNQVPDYDTTLAKSLASGEPPDVFYVDSFRFLDLVKADALAPIGDALENQDDFYPALLNAFSFDGAAYCPPKDFSTLTLQINTDMMKAAGIEAAPTTWEELKAAAMAMTTEDVAGIVISADMARWIAFLYQAGGSVTNDDFTEMTINSPEALEALTFYTDLYLEGYAKTPTDLGAGWNGEALGQGKAAMSLEGNWIVSYMKDNFPDVNFTSVELPAGPGGKATMAFTVCYGMPKAGANNEAAAMFVNYLAGDGMKAWTDLGLAMPTRASMREGWLAAFPDLEPYLNGADYARKWQFVPGFNQVLDKTNEQIQLIFAGQATPEDALVEIEKIGNEVLSKQ
jgi:multiple sugar transport system substrate-binding protein